MRLFQFATAALVTIGLTGVAMASSLPAGGKLNFDVIRKNKDIGDLNYTFSGNPQAFSVNIVTDIAVKLPLIRVNAYAFEQVSTESWKNGKLTAIRSNTNDDGTTHEVNLGKTGLLPASLWNDAAVKSRKLLNTIDGSEMAVKIKDMGLQQVTTAHGPVQARHYRISGELNRDVWYDGNGDLAHVVFTADDGSTITYLRK
ncbi:DUF6134 family protein [Ruegeria arenilitoris]|uniref:DUF6134 family protein n=1 Tax=Ruegeria arenilitoris TaxID=1173585 RepID=UPI00147BE9E8|nr:DUF6134 family protein [Ruegeria arenilitoris]